MAKKMGGNPPHLHSCYQYKHVGGNHFHSNYQYKNVGGKRKTLKHTKSKPKKSKKTICYRGYGSLITGNHTPNQFRKIMRKHHLYNCLCKYCKESKDKEMCALSRKCKRRNTKKRRYTSKQWMKWTNTQERRRKNGARYGKCESK
jgi:hypothetical protein